MRRMAASVAPTPIPAFAPLLNPDEGAGFEGAGAGGDGVGVEIRVRLGLADVSLGLSRLSRTCITPLDVRKSR